MAENRKVFHWRGWTTFVVFISFIVDTLSGIILYIAPPGRIANWNDWRIWWLTKDQWAAVHTVFGYALLFIVVIHLYYNWKLFVNFLWSKAKKALHLKRELTLAVVVCLVVFLGSIWSIPPFSTTMTIGEHFKEGWEESKATSPVRQAELLSLKDFAEIIKVPVEQITEILKSSGYTFEGIQQTVGGIAKANNVAPNKLYEDIQAGGAEPAPPKAVEGSGMGKKTLKGICEEYGLSLEEVLSRLKKLGIEAKPDDRLKDVATELGKTPLETLNALQGK
jgi:hypothetical protein